ncbi:MAG: hypothetical protein IK085_03505, partial [Clostridia bacterium]|nr:hypothetical protein [Clostridia bacterium]
DDRIHFLNTANSDAILIESNGKFALIDSGEGDSNPRRKTEYKGFEKETVDYILKTCSDENGVAHLSFILGTHCHYDHIGSFHAIIINENIKIDKAYFKDCDEKMFSKYDFKWGLTETYNQIMDDLESRNVPVIHNLPDKPFEFGDFTIQFYNTVNSQALAGKGENSESVGVKVSKGKKSAFLAADITGPSGVEDLVIDKIGDVDLLKIGHHGYYGSSSMKFLKALKPEIAIVTNYLGKVYPNVKWNLVMVAKCPFFATYDNNGIIAAFTDSDEIKLTNQIY